MNALMFKLTNVKGNIRVNDFYIELAGFLPIKGYLDITMSSIQLGFKAQFKKILQNGRLLPQISIIDVIFDVDMSQVYFDLGGGIILGVIDIIMPLIKGFLKETIVSLVQDALSSGLPEMFNSFVKNSQGFLNLGELIPDLKNGPYGSLTLDFQLDDDLIVLKERFEFAINGTIFNNDKGYRVPAGIKQPEIPMHDKNIDSKFQLFISNYLLDTFAAAFLEKEPFKYELQAA